MRGCPQISGFSSGQSCRICLQPNGPQNEEGTISKSGDRQPNPTTVSYTPPRRALLGQWRGGTFPSSCFPLKQPPPAQNTFGGLGSSICTGGKRLTVSSPRVLAPSGRVPPKVGFQEGSKGHLLKIHVGESVAWHHNHLELFPGAQSPVTSITVTMNTIRHIKSLQCHKNNEGTFGKPSAHQRGFFL